MAGLDAAAGDDRAPYLARFMAGGPGNPLGARAMYLGTTVYHIHGTIRPDNSAIAQTRDYLNWLALTLRQSADSGLDMTEVMALDIPAKFSVLNVLREEFTRSVAHLFPSTEQSVLPQIN